MSTILRFSSSAPTTADLIHTSALTANLAVRGETDDAQAEPIVDCALTLQLVESAAASMKRLESQLESLSTRGFDLLQQTRKERQRFDDELQAVRNEAERWKEQALASEASLRDATLRAWEADLYCRECELALENARQQAEAADARASDMEFYLKQVDAALRSRFPMSGNLGRSSEGLLAP